MKMPKTIVPMNNPMYTNLMANGASMMCFFGFRGGSDMTFLSGGSTPSASEGRMSVPTLTERMRTAVSGAGSFARMAAKTVMSSPILHENM